MATAKARGLEPAWYIPGCEREPAWQRGREGTVAQLRSVIYYECRTVAPEHTPCTMPSSARSLRSDHSPPREVQLPSSYRGGSWWGMGTLPMVAQLAKGRANSVHKA